MVNHVDLHPAADRAAVCDRVRDGLFDCDGRSEEMSDEFSLTDGAKAAEGKQGKKLILPDYNQDGTANPVGDAAYWRARAEAAEAKVSEL